MDFSLLTRRKLPKINDKLEYEYDSISDLNDSSIGSDNQPQNKNTTDLENASDDVDQSDNKYVGYKRISYKALEQHINYLYYDKNHKYSNALDIMASYLKGQKLIYTESKNSSILGFRLMVMLIAWRFSMAMESL